MGTLPVSLPVALPKGLPVKAVSVSGVLARLKPTPWSELDTVHKVRRVAGILAQIGAFGMATAAMTSGNEVGLRADGSLAKEHRDEIDKVEGDPKNKAQRDQAGEQKKPADSDDVAGSSNPSGEREAQGGNAAEDTEKAAKSTG
jgi:hypothetical protein